MTNHQSFNVHFSRGKKHAFGISYRYKDTYLDLYPGKPPYMRTLVDTEENRIEVEMILEAVHDECSSCRPHMNDPTQFYMHSDYPAYLVLDCRHTPPRLIAMSVMKWRKLIDNIRSEKTTWKKEKLLAHICISTSEEYGNNVAIYFRNGDDGSVYYLTVDESTNTWMLSVQKEQCDKGWRKHAQFTQFQMQQCSYLHTLPTHCTSRA